MFPFFTVFFLFVVVLNLALHKSNRSREDAQTLFWERELEANHTRKKDISALDYIQIPLDLIPQNLHTDSERELVALASEKLLNLTGETNTDLKLKYGVANLEQLSLFDTNFARFVSALSVYAGELLDAGQTSDARALLEFAVECRADSSKIFSMLAKLYLDAGEPERIDGLIEIAKTYDSLSGRMIVQSLNALTE